MKSGPFVVDSARLPEAEGVQTDVVTDKSRTKHYSDLLFRRADLPHMDLRCGGALLEAR